MRPACLFLAMTWLIQAVAVVPVAIASATGRPNILWLTAADRQSGVGYWAVMGLLTRRADFTRCG